jgi:hypothetical protein
MPLDGRSDASAPGRSSDRAALLSAWEEAFGSPPPPRLSVRFLARALAHERQCREKGGIAPADARALRAIAGGGSVEAARPASVPAGAQLVREWNGRTYRVEVTEGGYRFDGKSWRSLTAIARRITGTNWSGPRFFGLTSRKGG